MKKIIRLFALVATMFLTGTPAMAQYAHNIHLAEPDSIGKYYILTSDSTWEMLPMEMGTIKEHRNKVSKMMRLVKKAASGVSVASAGVGLAGGGGAITGALNTMDAAGKVGTVGGMVDGLYGQIGNDVAFKGVESTYKVKPGKGDIHILYTDKTNENAYGEVARVVRFYEVDGDRRIQLMEVKPALLGKKEARKDGYIGFVYEKYGKNSHLITIPNNQLDKGEYGIILHTAISAIGIPVPTFSVK